MPYHPYFYELSPLYVVQVALTIWMLADANRRGVEQYWFWVILAFQPIGPWAYFFLYKVKDFSGGTGWLSNLFTRRPSLEELRQRVVRSPTVAGRLELGEQLVKTGAYAEALPHLEDVVAREPDHCRALFLLAQARHRLGQSQQAVAPLQRLIARQPNWGDYEAWRTLVEVYTEVGDSTGALAQCRELARLAPSLEHRCLLAECLLERGEKAEARRVVEQGLEDYRYLSGPSRRRDGRWVSTAKQLLKQAQ